jgi:hypothetical protein
MSLPSVREQREQSRIRAIRKAEHLDELADGYSWLSQQIAALSTPTPVQHRVVGEMAERLNLAAEAARGEASAHRARAVEIGNALALAARPARFVPTP